MLWNFLLVIIFLLAGIVGLMLLAGAIYFIVAIASSKPPPVIMLPPPKLQPYQPPRLLPYLPGDVPGQPVNSAANYRLGPSVTDCKLQYPNCQPASPKCRSERAH